MMEIMPGQVGLLDLVSVSMSPQHFKAFVNSMIVTLDSYEQVYGKLQIPDAETVPLRSTEEITNLINENRKKAAAINLSMLEFDLAGTRSRTPPEK